MARRSHKFLLYPTKAQERDLDIMLDTHRHLYNQCLGMRINAYFWYKESMNYNDCAAWFTRERKTNDWYKRIGAASAQATMRRLDKSFKNFFDRVKKKKGKPGFPRFKGQDRYSSFEYPTHGDGIKFKEEESKVRINFIGIVKVKNYRKVEGAIKTLSLKKEAGKWYLVLSCLLPGVQVPKTTNKKEAGFDSNSENLIVGSDGTIVKNPRAFRKEKKALRRAQRKLARALKGSNNRKKAKKKVQVIHTKVKNQRKDLHHKESTKLVNGYSLIAAEALSISNMLKNHRLALSISDAGWFQFWNMVRYKALEAGVEFVTVNPMYTSQICSRCGTLVPKELSERWHYCPHCGLSIDRDINAAINILAIAKMMIALAWTEPKSGVGRPNLVLQYRESLKLCAATESL
jgi:putative transposase